MKEKVRGKGNNKKKLIIKRNHKSNGGKSLYNENMIKMLMNMNIECES